MPENNQDIEIRSEEVQEILTKVPSWMIRWGNTLLLIFVVMLLAISWFVKYPDVINTQVMITTTNPPQKLYANLPGKFDLFLVKDNDTVKENTPLAIMENTANYEDIMLLKNIIDTLTVNKSNFQFPSYDLPPLILGDVNASFAAFDNDYYNYESTKRLNPYKTQQNANQYSVIAAKGRLNNMKEEQKLAEEQFTLIKQDFENRQKRLLETGSISQKEFETKRMEVINSERSLKSLKSSVSQLREAISNSTRNLKGADIEQQQQSARLLKKAMQSFYQLKKDIEDWEKRYMLKSDIKGQVTFLSVWDKNQNVKAGDLIFTVIPIKERSYIGKIEAPATNSGKIKKDQKVQIQLANYPSDEYGDLNGNIKSISPVPNQDGNYLIDVSIDPELKTSYDKVIPFRQEMKGTAKIITEDLRLIERFFYQLKNILD